MKASINRFLEDLVKQSFKIEAFPTHFKLSLDLQQIINDPKTSFRTLADFMSRDPLLVAKILSVANKSVGYRQKPIKEVKEAIQTIGVERLKYIAVSMVMQQLSRSKAMMPFSSFSRTIWLNSIYAQAAAQVISRHHLPEHRPIGIGLMAFLLNIGVFYLLYEINERFGQESIVYQDDIEPLLQKYHCQATLGVLKSLGMNQDLLDCVDISFQQDHPIALPPEGVTDVIYGAKLLADTRYIYYPLDENTNSAMTFYTERLVEIEEAFERLRTEYY